MIMRCQKCNVHWHYPVERCIYCGARTVTSYPGSYKVIASTKVALPSTEHAAPYYSLLLEDVNGFRYIRKSGQAHRVGEIIECQGEAGKNKMIIGIVGAGSLGKDIAKVVLQAGYPLVVKSRTRKGLEATKRALEEHLQKSYSPEEVKKLMKNLKLTTDYSGLKKADLILECVSEDLKVKRQVFQDLEKACGKKAIFASNTSSLSIDELSKDLKNPRRVIGIHFFNPATKMRLVEITLGRKTGARALKAAQDLVLGIGKTAVTLKDSPAFIANRLLMPYLNEAIILLEEGVASKEDIDMTIRLALNHPMGPFQLLDLIGLDVFVEIMENLYAAKKDPKYKPAALAQKMVAEGRLGRKTKEGFYKY